MNFELTASMMCVDFGHLEQEIKALEQAGIDSFHIDIMDGRYVPNFAMSLNNLRKGDTVYIHPEAEYHPSTTLQKIIDAGMVPGNAGQMYLPYVGEKIKRLIELRKEMGFQLIWDGACTADKIKAFAPMGLDGFVLGSSLLFGKKSSYESILKDIRELNL